MKEFSFLQDKLILLIVMQTYTSDFSEQLSANNNMYTRLDVIIPPVILALCLLLSLAVILYQRRRLQNNNRKESHKLTLRQADQTGTSGTYVIFYIR
jgi:hypothetical protein